MINRDSVSLWVGLLGGVMAVIAAQIDIFPVEWRPYITIIASIIAGISGKLATSPLPGAPKT